MILYLGTSSLVKLYVDEPNAETIREWVREAEIVATCRVAYMETMSAFERRFREKDFSKDDYGRLVEGFSRDWPAFVTVDFDELEAGSLMKKYGLRRFDAIHLSAAKCIKKARNDISLFFSSADEKLNCAAAAEGLEVLDGRHEPRIMKKQKKASSSA